MDPISTPSPKSPLEGWQLSWGGWFDNRHGEWWLLAQLALSRGDTVDPMKLSAIYPREPEAVTKWRERHGPKH